MSFKGEWLDLSSQALRDVIGWEGEVTVRIEEGAVRKFAEAVGIPFGKRVPPTFLGALMQGGAEGLEAFQDGTVHGEQSITYHRPVEIGDCITCTRKVSDVYERTGKFGKMTLVVVDTKGLSADGKVVFESSSTVIHSAR